MDTSLFAVGLSGQAGARQALAPNDTCRLGRRRGKLAAWRGIVMFRSILAATICLLMLAVFPPALGGEREDLLELQKLTGLDTFFDGLDQQWGAAGAQDLTDKEVREAWQRATAESFVPETML